MTKKQVILIILDGWGYREEKEHNAIALARTPFFDFIWNKYPHSLLQASGLHVGLPDGQMGNSEVGHMTIGAGRAIDTDLVRISKAAVTNEFENVPAFQELFEHVKNNQSTLHVKGLIGPGGVHSHSEHLYAFLRVAKKAGVKKIAIHAFLDGRDTAPHSAHGYLKDLEDIIEEVDIGFIATACGRFYAMDRDNNWDRIKKAEDAIFGGQGRHVKNEKASEIVKKMYADNLTDEFMEPVVFFDDTGKSFSLEKNDGVMFFNFRADRARQISKKIMEKKDEMNLCFVTMTEYEKNLGALVAFPPESVETTLAAEISKAGLTQAHIAETEKFAHATYFLNGGKENPHDKEKHFLVESRKDISTHDQAPKMRAKEIADKAVECINDGFNFIFINFANADMVGHTADVSATIEGVEEVDAQLKRVAETAGERGAVVFVTADHGNAEFNFDKFTNTKHTAHTVNPVPAILIGGEGNLRDGSLRDIAPTILNLLGIEPPESMTGQNLNK